MSAHRRPVRYNSPQFDASSWARCNHAEVWESWRRPCPSCTPNRYTKHGSKHRAERADLERSASEWRHQQDLARLASEA